MLKPFLIRDLHEDPPSQNIVEDSDSDLYNATDVTSVGHQPRHGLVQLSAADYDEVAYIHPRARLTYLDDDDGETITVGSALELSQRLDEPSPQMAEPGFPDTIHLFDIRRSKSITDLWKKFDHSRLVVSHEASNADITMGDLDDHATRVDHNTDPEENSCMESEQVDAAANATSESLLSAFEAEMARVMNDSQFSAENSAAESNRSSRAEQAESMPHMPRDTTEAFASALRNLLMVAELISSGVKSKLPELERHLESARRSLPREITDSMRNAFFILEEQVKAMASTINSLPETIRQESGLGSASRTLVPEFPIPFGAICGLRDMGTQIGAMGQTLLDAFETSVRSAFPGQRGGLFSNFSEATDLQTSRPDDLGVDLSSRRHNTTPALAVRSRTMPAAPLNQGDTVGSTEASAPRSPPQPLVVSGGPVQQDALSRPPSLPNFPHPFPFVHGYPPHPMHQAQPFWGNHYPSRAHPRPPPPSVYPFGFGSSDSLPFNATASAAVQPRQPHSAMTSRGRSHDSQSTRSLFIGNVGFNVTDKMIKNVFSSRGLPVDVNLPLDSRTSKHAGFGYLTFNTAEEATLALRDLQGIVVDGHSINLEYVDHAPITALAPPHQDGALDSIPTSARQSSGVISNDSTGASVSDSLANASDKLNMPSEAVMDENSDLNNTNHEIEDEMSRFPPVSQLEAHMLATQTSGAGLPSMSSRSRDAWGSGEGPGNTLRSNAVLSQPLPGSFPQDTHDDLGSESATESQPTPTTPPHVPPVSHHHHHHHRHQHQHQLHPPRPQPHHHSHFRRAATVRSLETHRRSFDSFEPVPALRRRATERHSLRSGPHAGPFGPRHRASFHHLSHPIPSQSQNLGTYEEEPGVQSNRGRSDKQRAVDECISALVQLGYGSEGDGGLQRMAVYAAAANGELVDAIEMIEEERKAYEQRDSTLRHP